MSFVFKTIARYLRLYKSFLLFSFSKGMEFRFDFYMRIIMDLFYYAIAIAFYKIMFLHSSHIGGWNEQQAMVFVSGYLIVDAVNMTLFSNNMWMFPFMINKGDLDYYLVRPVSSLFFISLRDFAVNSFVNLICALSIFIWAVLQLDPVPSVGSMILFLVMILNGCFLFYCLNAMANMIVFWTHNSEGFGQLVWSMTKFSERPDRIFKGWMRKILLSILPFGLMSSFPARIILDGFSWEIILYSFGISGLFLVLLISVWNWGLRNYSSASS